MSGSLPDVKRRAAMRPSAALRAARLIQDTAATCDENGARFIFAICPRRSPGLPARS